MKTVAADIRNNSFAQVYLFFGEEEYLKNKYRDQLCNALCPKQDDMNFSVIRGKDADPEKVIDLGETMPFFAERRVILLEDTGFFKKSCDKLPEYIAALPAYLYLVFTESEVDRRNRLYKAVKKAGRIVEFKEQTDKTLMQWAGNILKKEGLRITDSDMEYFLACTGKDMNLISRELEKLITYVMGLDVVTRRDIETVCCVQTTNRIFQMVRAVAEKDQKTAMALYDDLLAQKEPPMRILFLLSRQFHDLLQVRELMDQGLGQAQIAEKTGMRSFVVKNTMGLARQYHKEELIRIVEDFLQAEEDVKTGQLDGVLSVELMIVKHAR